MIEVVPFLLQKKPVLQMICALTSVNDERLYLDYVKSRGGKIENYQFEKKIGSGTYGKVYRASHRYTGYVVAIKSLEKARIRQQNMTDKVGFLAIPVQGSGSRYFLFFFSWTFDESTLSKNRHCTHGFP
jgi:serine/threonine protein kinase